MILKWDETKLCLAPLPTDTSGGIQEIPQWVHKQNQANKWQEVQTMLDQILEKWNNKLTRFLRNGLRLWTL